MSQKSEEIEILQLDSRVLKEEKSVYVGDNVNKRWAGRRYNYLYIHSPGGAFSLISF